MTTTMTMITTTTMIMINDLTESVTVCYSDLISDILYHDLTRGLQPVPDDEVFQKFGGLHLSISKINPDIHLNVRYCNNNTIFASLFDF